MLQILTNASIIWLCSLLVYELLLRKETFHRLNRFYLLLTFMAGLTLPLLPWGHAIQLTTIKTDMTGIPLVLANPEAAAMEAAAAKQAPQSQGYNWWLILYLAGMTVSILYLLRDLVRLLLLYRKAVKQRSGKWTIAETGISHSPFSFGRIIFACSREQYTEQQWQMVMQHEQQHYHSRHILDLALMQIAATLLWFHPLVYIYRYKLRLLHEYEVDSLQQDDIQTYGRFLLEQAALKPAPVLTHSFSFSPLKNRIHMMTRTTSKRSVRYDLLLLLPMLGGFLYCCAEHKSKMAADIQDNKVTKKGVVITYSLPSAPDTIFMEDAVTLERRMVIARKDPQPQKLNGKVVIPGDALKEPALNIQTNAYPGMEYIITQSGIESILSQLPDGTYNFGISKMLVDETGHIVSYDMDFPIYNDAHVRILSETDLNSLQKQLAEFLLGDDFTFTIEKDASGQPAPYQLDKSWNLNNNFMIVKDHKVTYSK